MSSLYSRFKTNSNLETTGVVLDLGDNRIRVARAGGSNSKYTKRAESLFRPVRRQVTAGTADQSQLMAITAKLYAETVVIGWQVKDEDDKFVSGVPAEDGSILPFTVENVEQVLIDLPDLLNEISDYASSANTYLQEQLEDATKNS